MSEYKSIISEITSEIHKIYKTANDKKFTIGVIGDFTVGKSSFVNAILGSRILPVAVNPTTAIITRIKYGKNPAVNVIYRNGDEKLMSFDDYIKFSAFTLDDFKERETTGYISRFKDVRNAVIYVNSDFLKENKLCIVDTLGLSAHEDDNQKTIDSIKESIAVIYVCGERGLSQKDIDFISNYLHPENKEFFLCINRIDLVKKSEREDLMTLVKLKLDEIIRRRQDGAQFDVDRIYQVSSLYQNYANGFTDDDDEDYVKGKDYSALSGFVRIMQDVGRYVTLNAVSSRISSVNQGLSTAKDKISQLWKMRERELETNIDRLNDSIRQLTEKIAVKNKEIDYIRSLFEGLIQKSYSLTLNCYADFSRSAGENWQPRLNVLVNKLRFDFTDYMVLEKDILFMKMNIFSSMKDKRYAQLTSISEFVKETISYLKESLTPVTDALADNMYLVQDEFSRDNSTIFPPEMVRKASSLEADILSGYEIQWATYRAVAVSAIENTWMKNKNRKTKMLNAAQSEAIKISENYLNSAINQYFQEIREYIQKCSQSATLSLVGEVNDMSRQISEIRNEIGIIQKNMNSEQAYFRDIDHAFKSEIEILNKTAKTSI